jgi:hypothetical protein
MIARFLALPFRRSKLPYFYAEIVAKNSLPTNSVWLTELDDGIDLSLARLEFCKPAQFVIQVVCLDTPLSDGGRLFRYSMQEGYGVGGILIDCIRQNALDCNSPEVAKLIFEEAVKHWKKTPPTQHANFLQCSEAKWLALKDLYAKTVLAADEEARSKSEAAKILASQKAWIAFAREAYRNFRLKFSPVNKIDKPKLKNLRRHRPKVDEINRQLVSGFTFGGFELHTYDEIARILRQAGYKINADAVKQRCNRLNLPKRRPGPKPL